MSDIVERLRQRAARMDHIGDGLHYYGKIDAASDREAADEIERLRKDNTALKQALGYPVPADEEVINNPYRCGVCEARMQAWVPREKANAV